MDILKTVSGMMGGGQSGSNPMAAILGMLQQQPGGLSGLVSQFQKGGLGDAMSSWIGTGQNLPVSGEQLSGVLGGDTIAGLAKQLGTTAEGATSHLTEFLPQIIDKLTPAGALPEGDWMSQAGNMLGGLLGKK
jgi:uncharacterized protein YidB (DUF937 family)